MLCLIGAEEMLEKLEIERKLLESRKTLPLTSGAFEQGDCKEMVEFWDEKKIEDWRSKFIHSILNLLHVIKIIFDFS